MTSEMKNIYIAISRPFFVFHMDCIIASSSFETEYQKSRRIIFNRSIFVFFETYETKNKKEMKLWKITVKDKNPSLDALSKHNRFL